MLHFTLAQAYLNAQAHIVPSRLCLARPQFFVILESFNTRREITVLSSLRDAALALSVFFRSQSFRTIGHGVTLEQRLPFVFFTQHFHYLVTPKT